MKVASFLLFCCFFCLPHLHAQTPEHDTLWKEQVPWEGVPDYYRKWKFPDFDFTASLKQWTVKRLKVRDTLKMLLGDIPPRPSNPKVKILFREQRNSYTFEKFSIDNEEDGTIYGYLAIPTNVKGKVPVILGLHSHGTSKDYVFGVNSYTHTGQDVMAFFVSHGYALMSIDNSFHGDRLGQGPSGDKERMADGSQDQLTAIFKIDQWFGRTIWGMQLRDEEIALDYLMTRPEIDANKVGVEGMSMGSTRSWWLAAMDERVKCVVAIACFTRYQELIQQRQINAHGIYTFIPGLLKHFDTEAIMGLIAPRPFLALTGDSDKGSPVSGIKTLERKLHSAYSLYNKPENFKSIIYPQTGHVYTDEMKMEMLEWFEKYLK